MTTETQTQTEEAPPLSMDARLARMEAQQEIIIELLRGQNARLDSMESKFDTKIDALDKKFDVKIDAIEAKFDTKTDALDKKFDAKIDEKTSEVNVRIDKMNNRLFMTGLGVITIVGAGVVTYVVSLLA